MLTGILFLVLTGIVWVGPGAVISLSAKKNLSLDFIQGMSALIIILLGVIMYFAASPKLHPVAWIALPVSGVINYLCFIVAGKAMKKGPSGLTWAIMQSSFVMPFLMGVLFFDVPCSPLRLTGLGVMLIAMYLMGVWGNTGAEDDRSGHTGKLVWLAYTLLAFVVAGLSQCSFNLPSYFIKDEGGGFANLFFRAGINSAGGLAVFLCSPLWNKNSFNYKGTFASIALLTVCTLCALSTMFCGLDILAACGAGAIGYPISLGSCIAAFLVYTSWRLKEKLSPPAMIGVGLCFLGIVLLAL